MGGLRMMHYSVVCFLQMLVSELSEIPENITLNGQFNWEKKDENFSFLHYT